LVRTLFAKGRKDFWSSIQLYEPSRENPFGPQAV